MFKIISGGAVATAALAWGYPQVVQYVETQQAQAVEMRIAADYETKTARANDVRLAAIASAENNYKVAVSRALHERQSAEGVLQAKYPHARLGGDLTATNIVAAAAHEVSAKKLDNAATNN